MNANVSLQGAGADAYLAYAYAMVNSVGAGPYVETRVVDGATITVQVLGKQAYITITAGAPEFLLSVIRRADGVADLLGLDRYDGPAIKLLGRYLPHADRYQSAPGVAFFASAWANNIPGFSDAADSVGFFAGPINSPEGSGVSFAASYVRSVSAAYAGTGYVLQRTTPKSAAGLAIAELMTIRFLELTCTRNSYLSPTDWLYQYAVYTPVEVGVVNMGTQPFVWFIADATLALGIYSSSSAVDEYQGAYKLLGEYVDSPPAPDPPVTHRVYWKEPIAYLGTTRALVATNPEYFISMYTWITAYGTLDYTAIPACSFAARRSLDGTGLVAQRMPNILPSLPDNYHSIVLLVGVVTGTGVTWKQHIYLNSEPLLDYAFPDAVKLRYSPAAAALLVLPTFTVHSLGDGVWLLELRFVSGDSRIVDLLRSSDDGQTWSVVEVTGYEGAPRRMSIGVLDNRTDATTTAPISMLVDTAEGTYNQVSADAGSTWVTASVLDAGKYKVESPVYPIGKFARLYAQ
jgi:hypothetical protein